MSAFIGNPAAAATGYRVHQADYRMYHHGYAGNVGVHAYRPSQLYRQAYADPGVRGYRPPRVRGFGYRIDRGPRTYRPIHARYETVRVQPRRMAARPAARPGGGLATFYDPGPRAPGFTAAHLSLPMGTRLLVTNLQNKRSVVVRIADRGPEAWTGRILDLSRVAAVSLGMIQAGVVPVTYRVVN